ncbi:hypothetical protein JXQ70_20295 [bacterium]|nr:hypothetical protein [bacterium]
MTVVNAIRFDDYSGAMVCDEQVSWGNMERKGDVGDKILPVIPPGIQKEFGLVAAYGGSGTSAVSEEIKKITTNLINAEYEKRTVMRKTATFLTIEHLAEQIFEHLCRMKRDHIDEYLFHRYGFKGNDLIRGYYETKSGKVDINQKEIIEEAQAAMTWKGNAPDLRFLYVNRGILSGYEPQEGFRIFYFNMMTFSFEPVQAIFQSIGSGQDTSDLEFADFVGTKTLEARRVHLDPVEAVISIIQATNLASKNNIGVGGYYNIVLFDGKKENLEKIREISDERAKLCSETVAAYKAELISRKLAIEVIGDLLFGTQDFEKAEKYLFDKCPAAKKLSRFFRGYKPE